MSDPGSGGFGGVFDPRNFAGIPFLQELAKILAWNGGPVNWELARQIAASVTSGSGRALGAGDRASDEFAQAVGAAELWLDTATDLPAVEGPARVLDTTEWVRLTTSSVGLGFYLEPVAKGSTEALTKGLPDEVSTLLSGMSGMGGMGAGGPGQLLGAVGAALQGVQAGTVAGHLSHQLLGTYDLGVPTLEPHMVGLVGDTARRFASDYDFDQTEFRYWLALREAAHRRQFAGVDWLRAHVAALVGRFAAGADMNPERLFESLSGMGLDASALSDPSRVREALEGAEGLRMEPTPSQRTVLAQLQALVSFTEAWVDTVVRTAAADKLPSLARFEEAVRRRRAEKGPGERFLEQLVGLDLKPGDVRAGQAFCDAVVAARGQRGLDRAWQSADLLPLPAEIADPSRWLVRLAAGEDATEIDDPVGDLPEIPDDLGEL